MRDGMTVIKTFTSETAAQVVLNRLQALGVTAVIQVDNFGGMHPHFDLTRGVHLLVADQDREQALALLEDSAEASDLPAWTCSACGEQIEGGFDKCWKCGADKS